MQEHQRTCAGAAPAIQWEQVTRPFSLENFNMKACASAAVSGP